MNTILYKEQLYYWSRMYLEQIKNRDNYRKLERTVCINILNFKYLDNERYHNVYRLKEVTTNEELTDFQYNENQDNFMVHSDEGGYHTVDINEHIGNILKEGSGSYTSQWKVDGEHLITDINYIGYVTFDYGEVTIFKPKVKVIEGK